MLWTAGRVTRPSVNVNLSLPLVHVSVTQRIWPAQRGTKYRAILARPLAVTARVLGVLCSSSDSASFLEVIHERDWYYPSFLGPHTARSRIKVKENLKLTRWSCLLSARSRSSLGAVGVVGTLSSKGDVGEATQTTSDQPVDDEAVYYKVAGKCPNGRVYSLRSLGRKKRRYVDPDASTSEMLAHPSNRDVQLRVFKPSPRKLSLAELPTSGFSPVSFRKIVEHRDAGYSS
ncbi:hypothetical protein Scep_016332 [Stephania cephalantha]|uniref:Uncharacterized protein n=1 Tax=Stephania cephalantha TaxID=152367 RepID=A0AAP0NU32_9MAGN